MRVIVLLRWVLLFTPMLWAQDFVEGEHYHKMRHIKAQETPEIHYFFSFYCPSCARLAEMMDTYLYEQSSCMVYRHPLVNSQSGVALLRAYQILVDKQQGHCYKKLLYQFSPQQKVTDREILQTFKQHGHHQFAYWWEQSSATDLEAQMKSDGALVKEYRLKAIPTIVVVGPKGGYYIQPTKALSPDQFTVCLDYVVGLQAPRR